MLALQLTPAALAALVLAAHFLRRGQWLGFALALGAAALLFVRRPWAVRVVQAALALGALEWTRTLVTLVNERRAEGGPWQRLVIILGGVIAVTLLGAALLFARRVRAHYAGAAPPAPDAPRP